MQTVKVPFVHAMVGTCRDLTEAELAEVRRIQTEAIAHHINRTRLRCLENGMKEELT